MGRDSEVSKAKGFRLSEIALKNLDAVIQKEKFSSQNQALNFVLENLQLEHIKKENNEDFFRFPPYLYCPLTKMWVTKETLFYGEASCLKCQSKKECPLWNQGKDIWISKAKIYHNEKGALVESPHDINKKRS